MHGRVSLSVTLSRELDAGPMGHGRAARWHPEGKRLEQRPLERPGSPRRRVRLWCRLRSTLCAGAAFSQRCAARRAGPCLQRSGGRVVAVLSFWLHRGAMAAPSPWRCRCWNACFPRLRLWIGHCLWQDGTRALERALPTPEHSPDRACVLRSMHRLAWTWVEAGLDESRSTSSIMMLAMER